MPKIVVVSIRKVLMIILIIVVSILVGMAFYSNKDRFSGQNTAKYIKISLKSSVSVLELADKYSDSRTKKKFVSELIKVNGLSSTSSIDKSIILIPVFESN